MNTEKNIMCTVLFIYIHMSHDICPVSSFGVAIEKKF